MAEQRRKPAKKRATKLTQNQTLGLVAAGVVLVNLAHIRAVARRCCCGLRKTDMYTDLTVDPKHLSDVLIGRDDDLSDASDRTEIASRYEDEFVGDDAWTYAGDEGDMLVRGVYLTVFYSVVDPDGREAHIIGLEEARDYAKQEAEESGSATLIGPHYALLFELSSPSLGDEPQLGRWQEVYMFQPDQGQWEYDYDLSSRVQRVDRVERTSKHSYRVHYAPVLRAPVNYFVEAAKAGLESSVREL